MCAGRDTSSLQYIIAKRAPIGEVNKQVVVAVVPHEGLVGHNIKAFNDLIDEGIPQILTDLFQTELDHMRKSIKINIQFYNVNVGSPTYTTYPVDKIMPLYPNEARLSGRTNTMPLSLVMEVMFTCRYGR